MATTTTTSCSLNRLLGEDDDISFFTLFFFTPLFESDVGRCAQYADAGIVDQDIDTAKALGDGRNRSANRGRIARIGLERNGLAAVAWRNSAGRNRHKR